ncbi:MAG TPA: TylF/MycF/NovP-related O-methyltransferase [Elusimicrobiota bacterium]|nr:TylF/MycF/NovP-related O-methyltransferase [Elusimicrobiota bacterium]
MGLIQTVKNIAKKSSALRKIHLKLHVSRQILSATGPRWELIRLFHTVRPYTMVSNESLRNVYELAWDVERRGLAGAFVECGVWKGGCSAVMAYVRQKAGSRRPQWLFDSFEGLPEPIPADGAKAEEYSGNRTSGRMLPVGQLVASIDDVREVFFKRLKLDEAGVRIRKGWFQDTLPAAREEVGNIALLRLDGDWYESTRVCLENLYDRVVSGGYVVIDDYGHWEGCQKAVDEFFKARDIRVDLKTVDYSARYFKKP